MKHQQQSMDGYEKSPDISIALDMLATQPPHLPTFFIPLDKDDHIPAGFYYKFYLHQVII